MAELMTSTAANKQTASSSEQGTVDQIDQLLPGESRWLREGDAVPFHSSTQVVTANIDLLGEDDSAHLEFETIEAWCKSQLEPAAYALVKRHLECCEADCRDRVVVWLQEAGVQKEDPMYRNIQEIMLRSQKEKALPGIVEARRGQDFLVSIHLPSGAREEIVAELPYFAHHEPRVTDDVLVWRRRASEAVTNIYWLLPRDEQPVRLAHVAPESSHRPLTRAERLAPILLCDGTVQE